ncbi:thymidine kinase [Rhodopirellula sallentina]|uniref:Thymidine kinase n=1 Tax=Rhodopirellula sallentina SM41 TaxID=1263870 RepID=M5U146_9BACT|nr:thymidine kinase [Rhodopirellula sallentina]EMI54999.1 thymidine kinase [Rhodopirellula sallentina SM41]
MAKLYFYYSAMNAGKSTMLLQSSYNYRERGMNTLILSPEFDTRFGSGKVASRIGIASDSVTFTPSDNLNVVFENFLAGEIRAGEEVRAGELAPLGETDNTAETASSPPPPSSQPSSSQPSSSLPTSSLHCVLVDEAQFLTRAQVRQLSDICDWHNTPVLAYGLRTDFQGNLFEGSEALLAWADSLVEIKTICHCGRKATMVLRIDAEGKTIKDGSQIQIGGNDRYVSVCRQHFKQGMSERSDDELPLID